MNIWYAAAAATCLLALARHGKKRTGTFVISVNQEVCTGCGRCVRRCSHDVLEIERSDRGAKAVARHPERCTACKNCMGVCEFRALALTGRR